LDTIEPPPYNLSIRWKQLRYGPSLPCEVCQNQISFYTTGSFCQTFFLKKHQESVDLQNKMFRWHLVPSFFVHYVGLSTPSNRYIRYPRYPIKCAFLLLNFVKITYLLLFTCGILTDNKANRKLYTQTSAWMQNVNCQVCLCHNLFLTIYMWEDTR